VFTPAPALPVPKDRKTRHRMDDQLQANPQSVRAVLDPIHDIPKAVDRIKPVNDPPPDIPKVAVWLGRPSTRKGCTGTGGSSQ
jgi:hypothetical protein